MKCEAAVKVASEGREGKEWAKNVKSDMSFHHGTKPCGTRAPFK